MPAVLADLCIEARWIATMSTPGRILENHSLVVRDGRILDIVPSEGAADRYAATTFVQRPAHLLMPGLVNSSTRAASALFRALLRPGTRLAATDMGAEFARDGTLLSIAGMLVSGTTCFADRYGCPEQTALAASEQGIRAVIGLTTAESLTLRDDYKGHPLISTAFAAHAPNTVSDATFVRLATLADELDAPIMIDLHESAEEIAESLARHGLRPIARLSQLGLLTPALNAIHMVQVTPADIELAQRTGIAVSLCPQSSLQQGFGSAPAASMAAAGIRLGLGSGGSAPIHAQDIWEDMRLLALTAGRGAAPRSAWEALAIATRGGAAVLGLDAETGTLEPGKWADLCCADLSGPATQPVGDPIAQLVFCGGRDMVSDVWVGGRQLLAEGDLTRLDWRAVAARADAWAARLTNGG